MMSWNTAPAGCSPAISYSVGPMAPSCLDSLLLGELLGEQHRASPERCCRARAADAAGDDSFARLGVDDVEAARRVGRTGHVGHLAHAVAGRVVDAGATLPVGPLLELAQATTTTTAAERLLPAGLLDVRAVLAGGQESAAHADDARARGRPVDRQAKGRARTDRPRSGRGGSRTRRHRRSRQKTLMPAAKAAANSRCIASSVLCPAWFSHRPQLMLTMRTWSSATMRLMIPANPSAEFGPS